MKMKKFLIVSVAVLSLFMVGCGKKKEEKKNEKTPQEIAMEKYAEDYYLKFMNKWLTTPTVSIEALKKVKNDGYTDYDLSDLEKCKDTSYTELVIEEGTGEITKFIHHLDCN